MMIIQRLSDIFRSVSLVSFFSIFSLALAIHSGTAAERFAPDTRTFMLENGMQVVWIPDHRTPVVTHMVWYKVGSADEPAGKTGVAHFLEHLLFKGTKLHPKGEFSKLVARNGGQENAFTSTDYTGYFQRVAKEHLPLVMGLEADRMANLVLSEKETISERNVILEERRSRVDNNPGSQLREELMAALYRSHPYGRPVIGWEHEIKALNRKDAIEFYNTYYSPNNAVLVIAGDVSFDEVKKLAEKYYGGLKRRAEPGKRVRTIEPPHRAARRVELQNARVSQPSVRRLYVVPGYATAPAGEAEALDILGDILGGGTTSRLYRKLAVEQKIATGAGGWYSGTALDSTQFGVYGMPRGEHTLAQIERAIDAVIDDIKLNGVTEKEVERSRNSLIAQAVYAQDSQSSLARVFGAGLTSGQSVAQIQSWPNAIAKVTAADVLAVARKYLNIKNSVTGLLTKPDATTKKAQHDNKSGKSDG